MGGIVLHLLPLHTKAVVPIMIYELNADLFSRHACPSARAVFLLWWSAKQMGVHIVVPRTRYQVYCKKQAGRFSQSERKRIWEIFTIRAEKDRS